MRKPIQNIKVIAINKTVKISWNISSYLFENNDTDEFSNIKIFRREESFVFNEDYEEFFLNMTFSNKCELLFDGHLIPQNNRKFIYQDESASIGKTYTYWIQTKNTGPIGPFPIKIRDPEVWWSYEKLLSHLTKLKENYPNQVELSNCGQTSRGLNIPCIRIGHGKCTMGMVGAIHAGESGPELIIPVLEKLLKLNPEVLKNTQIIAIPSLNIDSREAIANGTPWYIRTNANGVDLNRNFPAQWNTIEYGYGLDSSEFGSVTYRGTAPLSANETKAVVSVFENERPQVVFGYHALASISGLPALASKFGEKMEPYASRCQFIIENFSKAFYPEPEFTGKILKFSGTSGSLTTWFFEKYKIPAFDFEMGVDKKALEICLYDKTDQKILTEYQNRHYSGVLALLQIFANESK